MKSLTSAPPPAKNSRWLNTATGSTARVMSEPIEGYVVARFKGAMPFLLHVNDWHKKFRPVVQGKSKESGAA